jgi:hypothetical protein
MKLITAISVFSLVGPLANCEKRPHEATKTPEPHSKEVTIQTEEGTVVGHTTDVDDVPQEVTPVNAAESLQFAEWAGDADAFLTAYGTPQSDNELKQYDEAFRAWQESTTKTHSDQEVIKCLGAYLGQRLVRDLNMEWVTVTDKYGKDYAVRHRTSEVLGFPFSSVMKRIEDKENDFIYGVYHFLRHKIGNGKLEPGADSEPTQTAK